MTDTIDANTLREWLEAHQPVTVLDVRSDEDRAQWSIPGSRHVDAYEALRAGQPGALANATLPHDRPVVTVCNAGRMSQTAAAILAGRGFDARSLDGRMKAWTLAWNTADVSRERARALFHSLLRLRNLPSTMQVLPAHANEPIAFDRQAIGATLGDVSDWLSEWLASEPAFVERVIAKLPPTPPHFARIVELNESGDALDVDPADLEAGANRCAVR